MTRSDLLGSLSCNMLIKALGTTCHDTPNLSLNQPHCDSCPPSALSFAQKESTSSGVSQFTTNEIDSLNLKTGPPLSAVNFWPSSSNSTVMTDPAGRPAAFSADSP